MIPAPQEQYQITMTSLSSLEIFRYFTAEYAELTEKGFNYSGLKPGIKDFDFTLRPPRSLR
jgi:HJR/Mrr/RecB family endonuclease